MNAVTPAGDTRNAFRAAVALRRTVDDRAFLAPSLELLETPASPTGQLLLWVLCAMFAAALGWSWFAKLDINAVASGRIQVNGRSKIVQPLEPGKIKSIHVQNGSAVKAGDLLLELDSTEVEAELAAERGNLEALDGEIARRTRAVALVRGETDNATIPFSADVGALIRTREVEAMRSDLLQYAMSRDVQLAQIQEKQATKQRLNMSIEARQKLVASLAERVTMREELVTKNAGTRAAVLDALQQLESEQTNLAYDRGQLIEMDAAISTMRQRLIGLIADFAAVQSSKLTEAKHDRDRALQDTIRAGAKKQRTRMMAPIDGVVQQLAVTTVGQVVTSGESLMLVVPTQVPLEIVATVQNRDIGFIEPGQKAIIKIDSFPFTRYGTMEGTVLHVARDAIDQRDGRGSTQATSVAEGQGLARVDGSPDTSNLVFQVMIALDRSTFAVDGRELPLAAGMTAMVEIRTGERRVIDYVLSPLRETSSAAGHER